MLEYSHSPASILELKELKIYSFIEANEENIDSKTLQSFGEEWGKFHQFTTDEIDQIGNDYFDLANMLTPDMIALDVGCGSGRWARYLSSKLQFIEAIDPSNAVYVAAAGLHEFKNIRVTQASVSNLPFKDNAFDFVYSLGVLHHVPNTLEAIQNCFKKTKTGGWFLVYLYYNLENRGFIFRSLFTLSTITRRIISMTPSSVKHFLCEVIAVMVYWPLAKFSLLLSFCSERLAMRVPLSYYKKTSFFVMRNDALDRFGTPLEKRFSKKEIWDLLDQTGFVNIQFSSNEPYWHAIAQKP
jgi:ubiquinone/menaquinone biosynthesis C-methylase UbiE